jgi:hypothetical protein
MTEQKPAGATRIQSPRLTEQPYEYICRLEEQRCELTALTQSCLKKGFRLCDIQAMYIHHVISTCKYLTDDPDTIRTTKQTDRQNTA